MFIISSDVFAPPLVPKFDPQYNPLIGFGSTGARLLCGLYQRRISESTFLRGFSPYSVSD
jgi:hypothetical protein